ncbi:hypothetical protein RBA25_003908 [Cronobacter turicensis]|uniref:hypothetical protein n=1 Tax=Cronobacter turicensis TaxID=413502 RepID=UPI0024AFA1BE|nr:hypothetical protein [Cronobacter turicensis]EKM0668582.1 hypothetical protein [Cronobacter turicensis]EKY3179796.1 hypothetical protein [Cronobacter turicensis]ELY4576464.1 hypothetical protein [Cronobacter turicensis]ELY4856026.1 hypothetical protein [Cronobacter turicensis]MDI7419555.1 hypothetical protein [Cronobacter turicensis]
MSALLAFFFPPRTASLRRLPYLGWLFGLLFGLGLILAITPDDVALALFLIALLLYYRAGALRARDAGLKARNYLFYSLAMWIAGIVIAYLRGFEPGSIEYMSLGGGFQVVMTLLLLAAPASATARKEK